jgi:hypothetical protein
MSSLEIRRADARVAALERLIDYAGLFPPESLDMSDAVAGYRAARAGDASWIVDRFICPVSRLEELAGALMPTMAEREEPWRLAVVGDAAGGRWLDAVDVDVSQIRVFDAELRGGASVEVYERRVEPGPGLAGEVAEAARRVGRLCFFEVPWRSDDMVGALEALAVARAASGRALGAKLRSGGPSRDAFPPPDAVARFLSNCARLELSAKATAGLHHPFRHVDEDTGFTHHGFVNLLVAAVLALDGTDESVLEEVVADTDPASFLLDRSGVGWKGNRVAAAAVSAARDRLFVAYGSCSVDEPVADLTALGVLPVTG